MNRKHGCSTPRMTRSQPDHQRTVRNFMLLTMTLVPALLQRTACRPTDAGLSTDHATRGSPDHPHSQHLRTPRTWSSPPPEPLRRLEAGPQTRDSSDDGGAQGEKTARSSRQHPRRTGIDFSHLLRNKDVKNDKKKLPNSPKEQDFDRRAVPGFRSEATTTDEENQLVRSLFEQFTRGGGHSGSQQRRGLNVKAEEILSALERAFRGQSSSTIQQQSLDFRSHGERQTLHPSRLRPVRQEESPTTSFSMMNEVTRKVQNWLLPLTRASPTRTHSKIHSVVEGSRNMVSAWLEPSQRLPRGAPWGTWPQGTLGFKVDVEEKHVLSLRELVEGRWASRQPEAEEGEVVGEKHGPFLSDEPQHTGGHYEPQHTGGHSEPQHEGERSARRRRRQCCMDGWATHH